MDLVNVLKRPIITEKSTLQAKEGKYVFQVARQATKKEIKKAIEKFFGVKVNGVKTVTVRGKKRKIGRARIEIKRADWKKAIVQLKEGEKLKMFEQGE